MVAAGQVSEPGYTGMMGMSTRALAVRLGLQQGYVCCVTKAMQGLS